MLPSTSDDGLRQVAEFLAEYILTATNTQVPVETEPVMQKRGAIHLQLRPRLDLEEEGCRLDVTPESVVVTASEPRGFFYGMQLLRQLLPPTVEEGLGYDGNVVDWPIPAVLVEDAPRFEYRGMHLDVARHFFPVSFIKRYIDLLALYKFNNRAIARK